METKIKEVFYKNNRIEEIEDIISDLPVENCRESLFKYILAETHKMENKFEKEYISKLYHNIGKFIVNVENELRYKNMSKDELIEELNDALSEGVYSVDSMSSDDFQDALTNYSDKQLHPFIEAFMLENFNELLKEIELSKVEKLKKELIEKIEATKNSIEYHEKEMEKNKKSLQEREEELKKLK